MQEFELLENIFKQNGSLPSNITIPPGDDMGAFTIGNQTVLVTVDQLADGIHFTLETTSIKRIARKAVTRNLSDVAAMGATPIAAICAVSFPKSLASHHAESLLEHIRQTGQTFSCPVIGGDISAWPGKLLISITVFASMQPQHGSPILRSTAQPNDALYVAGPLGGSIIDHNNTIHHLDFTPQLDLAQHLAAEQGSRRPSAMIDISDGLLRDLSHIAKLSNLTAIIDVPQIPISDAALIAAKTSTHPPYHHALTDGEDYQLLFSAPLDAFPSQQTSYHGHTITRIGSLVPRHQSLIMLNLPDGQTVTPQYLGWEHHS
ncbi:thiamine-phosphate kinase [Poriferisphaera corsica]|nr:thiamine-phosphate kinase [Poriferisphaera corsica]